MKNSFDDKNPTWYRLDNSAKIYPATRSKTRSNVFRLSVVLKEAIDPEVLARALSTVITRFPCFSVRIRRGLFWYYLEHNPGVPEVGLDTANPRIQMSWHENNGFLYRVLYYSRTISLECFHSITDGVGGMEFLKALCAQYLRLLGYNIEEDHNIIDIDTSPIIEEIQDSFLKYAKKGKLIFSRGKKAYRIIGTLEPPGKHHITTGILHVDEVLKVSRAMNVSVTEYLVGTLIYVFYMHQKEHSKLKSRPITISVPINLRNYFESKSLRNFTISITVGIDTNLGEYSFEEIVSQVHHYMRYSINSKFLMEQMSANVSAERNRFVRITPLFIKNKCLAVALNVFHDSKISSSLSNVGRIVVPDSMSEHIERFEAMSSPSHMKLVNCVVVSHKNTLVINFTSAIAESDIEREFFRLLVQKGLKVKIESSDSQ